MSLIDQVKDKLQRHQERHSTTGHRFVLADRVDFMHGAAWDQVAEHSSIFLSRRYLRALESCAPNNTAQRYAMAYDDQQQPVVIVAAQVAVIGGEQLTQETGQLTDAIKQKYQERVLVCGNLVSSGLHGVGFAPDLDPTLGWRIVSEALYKIRQAEKLAGKIDFVMIKDLKKPLLPPSEVLERYSYRRIQTDPDMVLNLGPEVRTFDDYLAMLTAKYRGRIKKIIKTIDTGPLTTETLTLNEQLDAQLHALYLQVENKSATRLATLPAGYFLALQQALGEDFRCVGIRNQDEVAGFVSVIKEGDQAIAYYVGLDYQVNEQYPIYFRLLQLVIEVALDWGCQHISFGRTALEPKANLGAEPVEEFVWARHRVPVVNYMVRKLFRNVPFDEAPKRSVKKQKQ
ncbi:GNAT family N-acetyltransferase [Marinicella meishanensis]|uniref:GNAT family N-acetyltransferase n=1 Tax=Marinicella meishanensis TaxID=2873263 RepID=UPI001CBC34AE|nr:GNAT family N-acetyltransferase [Marinicella sp. NBU2979]